VPAEKAGQETSAQVLTKKFGPVVVAVTAPFCAGLHEHPAGTVLPVVPVGQATATQVPVKYGKELVLVIDPEKPLRQVHPE
jgi:hypothetical protein